MEQENDIMRNALISKQRLRNKLPNLDQTRLSDGQTERILSEINIFLHGLMNAEDARKAYQYLVDADLLNSFYDQMDRFKEYFKGAKRITYGQFENYFEQLSNRTGLFLEQQTQADRPLQETADQFTKEIAGHLVSKEMKAMEEVKLKPSDKLRDARNVLEVANETIQAIKDMPLEFERGSVDKLKPLVSKANSVRDFIQLKIGITPDPTQTILQARISTTTYPKDRTKLLGDLIIWRDQLQTLTDELEASEAQGHVASFESTEKRQSARETIKQSSQAESEGIKSFYTRSHASVRPRHSSEQQLTNQLKVLLGELSVGNHAVIPDIRKLIDIMHESGMVSNHEYSILSQKLANA